ncbi:rhomboid-domain-containing protein [Gyrodon lividus]|nr:rhomboid-domain-containing protein [Gyrodon lividus]
MLWTTYYGRSLRSLKPHLGPLQSRSFGQTSQQWLPRISRFASGKATGAIPSFRAEVARTGGVPSFSERLGRPTIGKQVAFFFAGSLIAFGLAVEQTQFETEYWSKRLLMISSMWTLRAPTTDEIRRARYVDLGSKLQAGVDKIKEVTNTWPMALRHAVVAAYATTAQNYLDASEGRRLCWTICGVNTAIFLLWKIPRLNLFMNRAFTHHPLSGKSYTLLTSSFSHKGFFHLVANSLALASFGSAATQYFYLPQRDAPAPGPEATASWHFLAFFISAGLFSGLVSHVVATKVLYPRLLSQVATQARLRTSQAASAIAGDAVSAPAREILPSLGASGAIYAAVTVSALAFPDAQVQLIFMPFFPISITTGVGGLVLLDIVGIIRGWKFFDHYSHLGGAAFGAFYYAYGHQWWNGWRKLYTDSQTPRTA